MSENKLINTVLDKNLINFFYLEKSVEEVFQRFNILKFKIEKDCPAVPFTACVKGYMGAYDEDKNLWIVQKIKQNEIFFYALCEFAYLMDFEMQTLMAPTILLKIDDEYYRGTKVVLNAEQISGYNYMESPIMQVLANDLINRWLQFDEDRNPNNYMIIQNSKRHPIVVAIDNNHLDLESKEMKITGNNEKFGWFRMEKTRFLTLLRPDNFHNIFIEDIDERLNLMMNLSLDKFRKIAEDLFKDIVPDPKEKAELIISNISNRRNYINEYFRKWIKNRDQEKIDKENSDYALFGETFMRMYSDKK